MMPQSSAKVIFSMRTRLRLSTEISATWALWLSRKLLQATPRAWPSGSGVPQPGPVGGQFQRPQGARVARQQVAAQVHGVAAGGGGELVDR